MSTKQVDKLTPASHSRRTFLKGSGALVVGFSLFGLFGGGADPAQAAKKSQGPLDSWLAIAEDGTVTVFCGKVDLGTGVKTAMGQIAAEELDVPFERVTVIQGDTALTPDQGPTVGAKSISRGGAQIRQAAATGRHALLALAAKQLGMPVDQLQVKDGVVGVRGDSSRTISYGELVGGQHFKVDVDAAVKVKDPSEYTIVGKPIARVDIPAKVAGVFEYVHNVRVPGMLHGRVVFPASANATVVSVDESSVSDVPGLVKVVIKGNFVGVVAEREEQAIKAAQRLKVKWSAPEPVFPSMEELHEGMRSTASGKDEIVADRGSIDKGFGSATQALEATYQWPFQMHGMIGPSCTVADVRDGKATVWSGTQYPHKRSRDDAAKLLGIPAKDIRVIYADASGCYGRLSRDDSISDAVLLSQAVGKPVRVQWMRQDEHRWEPKGPAHVQQMRAGLDEQGNIIAWDFQDRSYPWTAEEGLAVRLVDPAKEKPLGRKANGDGCGGEYYNFPNSRVIASVIPWQNKQATMLRTTALRAPGDPARNFASECFMDELAAAAGVDPIEFRLRHLKDSRIADVLRTVAQSSGWQSRPSAQKPPASGLALGRGVAFALRDGTHVAAVAEVAVNQQNGRVQVKRIVVAHDCGLVINSDGVRAQVEGNAIQSTSRALLEEVKFDRSNVTSSDWGSYPILSFLDVPEVEVTLINRHDVPISGAGEGATIPIPAAIANAIFDATGARLRQVPFTSKRVKAALEARQADKAALQS